MQKENHEIENYKNIFIGAAFFSQVVLNFLNKYFFEHFSRTSILGTRASAYHGVRKVSFSENYLRTKLIETFLVRALQKYLDTFYTSDYLENICENIL